jgi:hypothetical protein
MNWTISTYGLLFTAFEFYGLVAFVKSKNAGIRLICALLSLPSLIGFVTVTMCLCRDWRVVLPFLH